MNALPPAPNWPPFESLGRLVMALAVGLFVGLEREWRGHEAGLRTFGFAALFCGMGGMLGESYSLLCIALLGVLIVFLNLQSFRANQGAELTTSAALMVTGITGVTCGMGHTITPAAITVVVAGLLAWKERLTVFSQKLSAQEIRSAILLAILTFAILPVLPNRGMDSWGLLNPREAWETVVLIAAIGLVNYILWKIFGENGIELTGFLGGLVNSTVAVTELAVCVRESEGSLSEVAYRGVLLATAAMALRNSLLLGILAPRALGASAIPLIVILSSCALLVLSSKRAVEPKGQTAPSLPLKSPFSIYSALKFGFYFLVLQILGVLAQNYLGQMGFYTISILGGLFSSASAVASAGTLLVHGTISAHVAGTGAVLASLASASVNIGLVFRISDQPTLNLRLARVLGIVVALGILAAVVQNRMPIL